LQSIRSGSNKPLKRKSLYEVLLQKQNPAIIENKKTENIFRDRISNDDESLKKNKDLLISVIKTMIEHGAKVRAKNRTGLTPPRGRPSRLRHYHPFPPQKRSPHQRHRQIRGDRSSLCDAWRAQGECRSPSAKWSVP